MLRLCWLCALVLPAAHAYGRPPLLRGIQPLRWFSDALASVLLYPDPQVGEDVAIRPSPGKGRGLFAMRRYEAGEFICRYTGLLRSKDEFMRGFLAGETSGDYLYLLGGSDMYVDADDPEQSSVARFINHSLRRQNCAAADICLPVAVAGGSAVSGLIVGALITHASGRAAGQRCRCLLSALPQRRAGRSATDKHKQNRCPSMAEQLSLERRAACRRVQPAGDPSRL